MSKSLLAIKSFQYKNEDKINKILNHLTVIYMFFIPIKPHGNQVSFIFFAYFILLLLRGNFKKYILDSFQHPLTKAFLLFFLVHIFWLIGTEDFSNAIFKIKHSYYLLYPFFFFLFLDKRFFYRFINGFLAGVLLSEILSYSMQFHLIPWGYSINDIQFFWNELGHLKNLIIYNAIWNEPAPFLEHGFYSIVISLAAAILFFKAFLSKQEAKDKHYFSIIFFITMSFNLLFIQGRVGYVLYSCLILYLLFQYYKKNNSIIHIISLILIPLTIAIIMYNNGGAFQKRIHHTINVATNFLTTKNNAKNSSFEQRLCMAKSSINIIEKNVLFGVGTGDELLLLRKDPKNIGCDIMKRVDNVHNQYLEILMQFGIIGLIVYFNLLYQIYKYDTKNEDTNHIKILLLIAMIITGFFGYFWFLLTALYGMLLVISTNKNIIIQNKMQALNIKSFFIYIIFTLIIYIYGLVQ